MVTLVDVSFLGAFLDSNTWHLHPKHLLRHPPVFLLTGAWHVKVSEAALEQSPPSTCTYIFCIQKTSIVYLGIRLTDESAGSGRHGDEEKKGKGEAGIHV